jgi:hypothetical protein
MAVIIDDGHVPGMLVVEGFCCFGFQQEIFIEEFFHGLKN